MIYKELIIIGGGPSGLCAAKIAAEAGIEVMLFDGSFELGGQLIKQTHKFFGSKSQYAKMRGFDIAKKLINDIKDFKNIEIKTNTTVVGLYPDYVITAIENDIYTRYQAKAVIVATGASEKSLAFENNDLPGIYGAGAVQTLMNLYGIIPGNDVVMVGSGNIGLIVSYQLMQAGVNVKAIVEASKEIGGYKVHASKMRRLGVPILTSTTVKRAIGKDRLEQIELVKLDNNWEEIENTSEVLSLDALCISVGLSPVHHLLSMVNAETKYVTELGGFVPVINNNHETTVKNIYVCGDAVGIEEASSAMMEGYLTGLYVSDALNKKHHNHDDLLNLYTKELNLLRDGPFGIKTKIGLEKLRKETSHA